MRKTLPALPELVMETSQEHQGPSDTQSTTELGTKEFTEPGRRGAGGEQESWVGHRVGGWFWNGTQEHRPEKAREKNKPLQDLEIWLGHHVTFLNSLILL